LKLVDRTRLHRWFNGGSDDTARLPFLLLKIRSVRMLNTIVCSGNSENLQYASVPFAVFKCIAVPIKDVFDAWR
jgi:hypothetical protein